MPDNEQTKTPPTPFPLPGGWTGPVRTRSHDSSGEERRWRVARQDEKRGTGRMRGDEDDEDEALLLPPPFLASDSPRESFDGLLGARRARLESRQQPLKVVRVLGPPGGYDAPRPAREGGKGKACEGEKGLSLDEAVQLVEGAMRSIGGERAEEGRLEERQRRRVRRAESGLRAYEVGAEMGRKVAGRLERHRSTRETASTGDAAEMRVEKRQADEQVLVAATPSQLLGSPPSPAFRPTSTPPTFALHDVGLDVPPDLPPVPSLRPLSIPDHSPLPTVSTPLFLDPAALDDYFGFRPRASTRRASISLTLPASPLVRSASLASSPRTSAFLQPVRPRKVCARRTCLDTLIYVLIGSPSSPSTPGLDSLTSVVGLVGILVHIVGFVFFVGYHLTALIASSVVALRTSATFLYWAWMNLSGRTEVAQSVVEYWRVCRIEWDKVCEDEGEERLSAWSVVLGLAELAALQGMTHARWLREGPGQLVLLNGDVADENGVATLHFAPLRRKRSVLLERPSVTQRQQSYLWAGDGHGEDGEGLVVTSQKDGVLLGSLITSDNSGSRTTLPSSPAQQSSILPAAAPATIGQLLEKEPPPLDLDPTGPSQLPSSPPLQPVCETADPLDELVALIKRCCRLSTASYGLHTLIPSPPTPLLTPSGQTLPQRVFAHLGGVGNHRDVLHVAIQQRYTGLPATGEEEVEAIYAPQLFVLRDDARGEIIVIFRGTQSLADLRTDLDSSFVPIDLPPLPPSAPPAGPPPSTSSAPIPPPHSSYRIHSGILTTAQHLLSPSSAASPSSSPLLPSLRATLAAHPRYALVLTGHSLGAALASTVALLLGAWDAAQRAWVVRPDAGLGADNDGAWRRPLRAVCFAHPTTVNAPLAARAAFPPSSSSSSGAGGSAQPLVLNVSLASDVICRMGVPHVRGVRRAVGRLDRARRRRRKEGAEGVLSVWRAWRRATDRGEEEDEAKRVEEWAWEARGEAEGWARDEDARMGDVETAIPAGRTYHIDRLPPALEKKRREELGGEEEEDDPLWGLYEVRDSRRFFALPLLRGDLLSSHMPKDYLNACESL
ncbi:hypothetical protein JCM10449v2_005496 [Rhodotorula kratochvilovae]